MSAPLLDLLTRGSLRVEGRVTNASNATFVVEVDGGATRAIYKPRDGEAPLWDFPDGTLYRREVAAYALSAALGWPSIPPTVAREGPYGIGAVQLFVEHDPEEHYFTLAGSRRDDFRRFAAFDVVANNADRKAGHCLLGRDGVVWGVDHGVCFGLLARLRTVIWEFAGEPLGDLGEDVARVAEELRGGPLRVELLELLSNEEVDATAQRATELASGGVFPEPGPGRAFPWPPV